MTPPASSRSSIVLSVVVPCYNDFAILQRQLPPFLDYLKSLGTTWEVIVCDDGSRDPEPSRKFVEGFGQRFLASPANEGKGAAVRRGMLAARGQFRIFTDVDIPFEYEAMGQFLHYLDHKEFHMVVGDRNLPGSSYYTEVPWLRRVGSRFYAFIVGGFIAGGWYDTQCGIKGFRAEVARDLFGVGRIQRYGFDVELLHIALKRNYDIKRLPVRLRCQEGTHVRVFRDGMRMLWDLAAIYWHRSLGRYRRPAASPPVEQAVPTLEKRRAGSHS